MRNGENRIMLVLGLYPGDTMRVIVFFHMRVTTQYVETVAKRGGPSPSTAPVHTNVREAIQVDTGTGPPD